MHNEDLTYFHREARGALRMARAHCARRRVRVFWQERAADWRECVIDRMRRRQGWTLAERIAGARTL